LNHTQPPDKKMSTKSFPFSSSRVAVLIPCHNEEDTIAAVIRDVRDALLGADIIVADNGSSDATAQIARAEGARVIFEPRLGKGNAIRRLFADVDADLYIMIDGDGTYDAAALPDLINRMQNDRLDMLVAARAGIEVDAGRRGHAFGNKMFNRIFSMLFGRDYTDIFSGYRVFSRRFVKSFPALSSGFEIETEMAVHASELRMPVAEVVLPYGRRPEGSFSKLNSVRDGSRIIRTFFKLFHHAYPARTLGIFAGLLAGTAFGLSWPIVETYMQTGLVPRLPTAVLCVGLIMLSGLMAACGLILDSVAAGRVEYKRLAYLNQSAGWDLNATPLTKAPVQDRSLLSDPIKAQAVHAQTQLQEEVALVVEAVDGPHMGPLKGSLSNEMRPQVSWDDIRDRLNKLGSDRKAS
jgi:Glycosyl transferase family 2